jgi:hypothetical protein
MDCHLEAMHGWLGTMTICCTPMVRFGKWQMDFHRPGAGDPELNLDQSKNLLEVERGNDLLAALCIAYAFDKALCQPLVTIIGYQEKEHMDDDDSLEDEDYYDPEFPALTAPDYPQEEYPALEGEEFEPAGYIGNGNEEEPRGYIEAERNSRRQPEPAGYLESDGYTDDYTDGYTDDSYDQTSGYLESDQYTDDRYSEETSGYLDDGISYDDSNTGHIA